MGTSSSSSDFTFQVKADVSQPNTAAQGVERALDGIVVKASQTQRAVEGVNQTFMDAANRYVEALQRQSTATYAVQNSTEGYIAALQREAEMMDRIRGPQAEYVRDKATLDALLARNAISTQEYTAQLARMNAELQRSVELKGAGEGEPGGIRGFVGNMSEEAKTAAKAYVGYEGVKEVGELADAYTLVSNKLRVVSTDTSDFNSLMTRTFDIAQSTRMSWEETAASYQRLSNVTQELGLSQSQVLHLTEEMAQAAKVSGASTTEAQMAMGELIHGFATGAIQTREFRVLMRDVPQLMHELQLASGKTQEQFAEMGKHSQITAQMLIEWFGKADESIKSKFANTIPTTSERLVQLKNVATQFIGTLLTSTHVLDVVGIAFKALGDAMRVVGGFFQLLPSWATTAAAALTGLWLVVRAGLGPWAAVVAGFEAAVYVGDKLADYLLSDVTARIKQNTEIANTYHQLNEELKAANADLEAIHELAMSHNELTDALSTLATAMVGGQAILDENAKKWGEAHDKAVALAGAVLLIKQRVDQLAAAGAKNPTKLLTQADVQTVRDYVDQNEAAENALLSYGGVVTAIHQKERDRARAIQDLGDALKAGAIDQNEYNEAIKQYVKHTHDANAELRNRLLNETALMEIAEKKARERYGFGTPQLDTGDMPDMSDFKVEKDPQAEEAMRLYEQALTPLEKFNAERERAIELSKEGYLNDEALAKVLGHIGEQYEKIADKDALKKSQDQLKEMERQAQRTAKMMGEAFRPVVDSIVQVFTTGKLELDQLASQMEKTIVELAVKALMFKLLQGLGVSAPTLQGLGLQGFATGTSFVIGGGGGASDNQLVAFRGTTGERVTVEPAGAQARNDRAAGRKGGSSAGPSHIVNVFDKRALLPALNSAEGKRVLVNVLRDMGFTPNR